MSRRRLCSAGTYAIRCQLQRSIRIVHPGIHRIPGRRFSPFPSCVAHPDLKAIFNLGPCLCAVKLSAKIFYVAMSLSVSLGRDLAPKFE